MHGHRLIVCVLLVVCTAVTPLSMALHDPQLPLCQRLLLMAGCCGAAALRRRRTGSKMQRPLPADQPFLVRAGRLPERLQVGDAQWQGECLAASCAARWGALGWLWVGWHAPTSLYSMAATPPAPFSTPACLQCVR